MLSSKIRIYAEKHKIKEPKNAKAQNTANKIVSRIFISGYKPAESSNFLIDNKISAVLNCTPPNTKYHTIENKFCKKGIEYLRIPVKDDLTPKEIEKMYKYLPAIVEYIYKVVDIEHKNILIHCMGGQQRSCIALAAYFVAKKGMTPYQACIKIFKNRNEAFFWGDFVNFEKALDKYYKEL